MHHMTASAYKKQATLSKVLCLHKKRPASTTLWQSVYFNIKKVHSIFANFLLLQIKKKKKNRGSQFSWVTTKRAMCNTHNKSKIHFHRS